MRRNGREISPYSKIYWCAVLPRRSQHRFWVSEINTSELQTPSAQCSDHEKASADDVLQATIETLYHAVAILSYRSKSSERTSHSSASYVRPSFSASRVTSIVGDEFYGQLVLFPFVPYAVSLSLSVAYREMRHNKVPMYRARAQVDHRTNCHVLENLGKIFWSASVMAEMGKSTLRELDKVYSSVTDA